MHRYLPVVLVLLSAAPLQAHGLLLPDEKYKTQPLAMVKHEVTISIQDQAAETVVDQTFRNHTDRELDATYVFPVPKGASIREFSMLVNGVKVKGELVDGPDARRLCINCARRTQDPALLEYLGNNLFKIYVRSILPGKDQNVTLKYSALATQDNGLVEYVYPLKTDGKATSTLEKFSIKAAIKSQHAIQNVYSSTHALNLKRSTDRAVTVYFEHAQALLDKDFQLYYTLSDKDVGLTSMIHRPNAAEDGFFMFLISPRVEAPRQVIPRDLVLVLDTSGSMKGIKMDQARKALHHLLNKIDKKDRFALINFSTSVTRYRDGLLKGSAEELGKAHKWIDSLEATGGTAIDKALSTALQFRTKEEGRSFTVIFFTDGQPTIGEDDPEKILKNVATRNTSNTRIFTFGVGDDVNATMLDRLAENTRALCTYVRPAEDVEAKASGMYVKITHPVLTNLQLSAGKDVILSETYPPELPDLFHGGQLVVMGRYHGTGKAALTLSGLVATEKKAFSYDVDFQEKTGTDYAFVEHLWARRKVGYLLDQMRAGGEKKELVDETKLLARKYGIATPYTSYLITSEGPVPVVNAKPVKLLAVGQRPLILDRGSGKAPLALQKFLADAGQAPANVEQFRHAVAATYLKDVADGKCLCSSEPEKRRKGICSCCRHVDGKCPCKVSQARNALDKKKAYEDCCNALRKGDRDGVQTGRLGVDLSIQCCNLRNQERLEQTAQRTLLGRECIEIGGIWIDTGYDAKKTPTVVVKAMSDAYCLLLEKRPELKEVFRLGNHLVWVTPSGTALLIDACEGKETLTDDEVASLFTVKK